MSLIVVVVYTCCVLGTGYMNLSSDLVGSKKWGYHWCVVKEGRLDCMQDPGDDKLEFSLALDGITVELAAKQTKKDLAFKLVQNDRDRVLMEVSGRTCAANIQPHSELRAPMWHSHSWEF